MVSDRIRTFSPYALTHNFNNSRKRKTSPVVTIYTCMPEGGTSHIPGRPFERMAERVEYVRKYPT